MRLSFPMQLRVSRALHRCNGLVIHGVSYRTAVYAAASSADVTVVAGGIDYNNAQVGRS